MSDNRAQQNEKRFRRGTGLLLLVSVLSAGSTAALYYGIDTPLLYTTSLAVPVVTDIALKTFFAGWIYMKTIHYYWFLFSLAFAAIPAAVALLSTTISVSGHVFRSSFAGRSLSRVFSFFGLAQLLSARALSLLGILFYLLDAAISAALVLALPQTFTPYYLFLMGNLLLHLVVLTFLGYSFSARVGGAGKAGGTDDRTHGAP